MRVVLGFVSSACSAVCLLILGGALLNGAAVYGCETSPPAFDCNQAQCTAGCIVDALPCAVAGTQCNQCICHEDHGVNSCDAT